eukprot:CAMPEP_0170183468 /NCGR_PEP_ID=MMETSP0040_2-20121228/30818_1 /TAXON_ID=641309 /ORGANISM="Lotharella oceanica, Strain CCMP622" /LENGTH=145 /DNA_ID=CAMNT_0010429211 /DNA_START=159 /DNA_END=594 /DNA_ORIENTATION=-
MTAETRMTAMMKATNTGGDTGSGKVGEDAGEGPCPRLLPVIAGARRGYQAETEEEEEQKQEPLTVALRASFFASSMAFEVKAAILRERRAPPQETARQRNDVPIISSQSSVQRVIRTSVCRTATVAEQQTLILKCIDYLPSEREW